MKPACTAVKSVCTAVRQNLNDIKPVCAAVGPFCTTLKQVLRLLEIVLRDQTSLHSCQNRFAQL